MREQFSVLALDPSVNKNSSLYVKHTLGNEHCDKTFLFAEKYQGELLLPSCSYLAQIKPSD